MGTPDIGFVKRGQTVEKKEANPALERIKEQILKSASEILPQDMHHIKMNVDALSKAFLNNDSKTFVALAPPTNEEENRRNHRRLWENVSQTPVALINCIERTTFPCGLKFAT